MAAGIRGLCGGLAAWSAPSDPEAVTIAQALERGAARLRAAGVDSPEHDSEVLLRHLLGWDRARLAIEAGEALPGPEEAAFLALIEQRARRRPLQHLTGTQWFWKHEFRVGPDALIPRHETEVLVEAALELLRPLRRPLIVDVGTGSGCIALSLAAERADAEVHATEISAPALEVARENARRLGLSGRVTFYRGEGLKPVARLAGRIDLIASNPPYVDPAERESLAPEVAQHEPGVALFAPGDAAAVYRGLVPQAALLLKAGGWLLVELGRGMEQEIARICREARLPVQRVLPDLRAIPRVLVARRPP